MTASACSLILHYSTARLSWTTIKSLHRKRSKHDDVTPIEYEILMGWTLLAFHSIFVSSGAEYPISFIVPFYYYFKLLALMATFVLPVLSSLNPLQKLTGEGGGSNPFIVSWFNYVIVPGVSKVHELMDHDPKRWAMEQLSILPFLFLDFFILPGILMSDEERESVRKSNSVDYKVTGSETVDVPVPSAPPASLFQRDDIFPVKQNDDQALEADLEDEDERSSDSDVVLNPINQKSNQSTLYKNNLYQSPTRQYRNTYPTTPDDATTPFFPRTTPTNGPSSTMYITSPVAKSRVASSALRLRRFSREHEPVVKLTPRVKDLAAMYEGNNSKPDTIASTVADEKETNSSSRYSQSPDENESPNNIIERTKSKRNRRERLSLGDHFRELVTGDANIRVRDHLFDLELPSVPSICTSPRSVSPPSYQTIRSTYESNFDTANITTRPRRSSRLANKQDSRY